MLIGDDALWYATRSGAPPVWDLGEAWRELTGLPFVYAAWALQCGVDVAGVAPVLRGAKANGLAHLEEIVQDSTEATLEIRREYLTRHVWFELGDAEKQGIRRFQRYLVDLGLVGKAHDLRYVS